MAKLMPIITAVPLKFTQVLFITLEIEEFTKDKPHAMHLERSNLWKNLLYFIKDVLPSSHINKRLSPL